MANICNFQMHIKGDSRQLLETFKNMISQRGNTWMGRGAVIYHEIMNETGYGKWVAAFHGDVKWSVKSALIDNAESMRKQPDMWYFGDKVDSSELKFITLFEACEQLGLDMEVFSYEDEIKFQEHYLFKDGKVIRAECKKCMREPKIYDFDF